MRILFITSSRLAEAVISCGILEKLRTTYPKAEITVACGASCVGLFSRIPRLERVIVVGKGHSKDFHRFRLWTKLASRFWDIAIDTRGSEITRFLLTGQRKIVRIRKSGRRYEQIAEAAGFSPAPLPVTWTVAADEEEAARRLPADTPMIGLGPTASWERKAWPAQNFIETYHAIEKIVPGCKPVIFSGSSDAERLAAAAIQTSLPGAIMMPGTLSLPLLAACMARLRLFIGNDTGLLHLAAASGAPTLGLFGRTRADEFAPAGPHAAAVVAPGPPGDAPMEALTVDMVLAAIMPLLHGH
jgi:ADP-heptose:LPS heptosyltransferase